MFTLVVAGDGRIVKALTSANIERLPVFFTKDNMPEIISAGAVVYRSYQLIQ